MTGAIIQLISTYQQEAKLTNEGDPEVSFLEFTWSTYENFAIEPVKQTINGNPQLGADFTAEITKTSDFISDGHFRITLDKLEVDTNVSDSDVNVAWIDRPGYYMFDYVKFEIGGLKIDQQYGEFMDIYDRLTLSESSRRGLNTIVGQQNLQEDSTTSQIVTHYYDGLQTPKKSHGSYKMYVPLKFWWVQDLSLSFPVAASVLNPLKLEAKLIDPDKVYKIYKKNAASNFELKNQPRITKLELVVDQVFVPKAVRQRFVEDSELMYLVVQQNRAAETTSGEKNKKVSLNFGNPIKELVWVARDDRARKANDYANYSIYEDTGSFSKGQNPITSATFTASNQEFVVADAEYFSKYLPYRHHTRVPDGHIHMYPFGRMIESWTQPAAGLNFGRVDNPQLEVALNSGPGSDAIDYDVRVYALNWNFLKVAEGVSGLLFSA